MPVATLAAVPEGVEKDTAAPATLRWPTIIRWALAGTLLATIGLAAHIAAPGDGDPLSVILPGSEGPSAEVFLEDFPDIEFESRIGHDGQQVYAIARNPWNLEEVAPHLDRPTYRLSRPLLSWLGWALHPFGGGAGLAWALIAVEIFSVFVFAVAGGAVLQLVGSRPQLAALFPLLPGTFATLMITTADVLATGLVLAAIGATMSRRPVLAALFGALGILAKESLALSLGVFLLARMLLRYHRQDAETRSWRDLVRSPEIPIGVGSIGPWLLWSAWVRLQLGPETTLVEFGLPFGGLVESWDRVWSQEGHVFALLTVSLTYIIAVWAIHRARDVERLRPLWWALIAQLAFTTTFTVNVVGLDLNGPRTTMPLLVLALVVGLGATSAAGQTTAPARVSEPRPAPSGGP